MNDYSQALDSKGWSDHYNINKLEEVVNSIKTGNVSVWSEELIRITRRGTTILEIGCGTGISSLWLAKNNRRVVALDYTETSVELVKAAAVQLGLDNIDVILCDATEELPFEDKHFDYIFQAGLLEHFKTDEQIKLLRNWAKYGRKMVSMVPNAASIPYRIGKQIMEDNGTWGYGLEIPQHTFKNEFISAGIMVESEYTIGSEWALKFLPSKHYIRKCFSKMKKDGYDLNGIMQGYLLVTIGTCA